MASYSVEEIEKAGLEGLREDSDLRAFFFSVYSDTFGEACASCPSKLSGYVTNFLTNYKNMKAVKTQKFIFKKQLLHVEGLGHVNQGNMTDEKAVKMLSISSGYLKYFESYPQDWDKLVTKERAKKAKAAQVNELPKDTIPEAAPEVTPEPTPEAPGDEYRDKLIALNGIAEATADKILGDFKTEAALEAHIAAGKDLIYSPQANKALLEAYGG